MSPMIQRMGLWLMAVPRCLVSNFRGLASIIVGDGRGRYNKRNGTALVTSRRTAMYVQERHDGQEHSDSDRVGELAAGNCKPCEGGDAAAGCGDECTELLEAVPGWELVGGEIAKTYPFKNYYQTMAFVNATAWVSHQENHHPDLEVAYNKCRVRYSTHAIGGILGERFHLCGEGGHDRRDETGGRCAGFACSSYSRGGSPGLASIKRTLASAAAITANSVTRRLRGAAPPPRKYQDGAAAVPAAAPRRRGDAGSRSTVNCKKQMHISSVVCSPRRTRLGGVLGLSVLAVGVVVDGFETHDRPAAAASPARRSGTGPASGNPSPSPRSAEPPCRRAWSAVPSSACRPGACAA